MDFLLSQIWKLKIHNRLKMLLWRIASDILPTYNLLVLGQNIFWECHFARALWFGCDWGIRTEYFQFLLTKDLIVAVIFPPDDVKAISGGEKKFVLLGALILCRKSKSNDNEI